MFFNASAKLVTVQCCGGQFFLSTGSVLAMQDIGALMALLKIELNQ